MTNYPYTQKAVVFGLIIGTALLVWSFVSTPNNNDLPQAIDLPSPISTPFPWSTTSLAADFSISTKFTTTPTLTLPIPTITATSTPPLVVYTIEQGDILGIIAENFGVSTNELIVLNDISDPTLLQIGQALIIPVTPTPTRVKVTPSPTPTPVTYVVQSGDVLLAVAEEYSTTVEAIMIANGITNPRTLQIGQELIIPPDKGSILGVPTIVHEIEGGDTLLSLAGRYGSTVEDILATNPDLEPTLLKVGLQIVVPLTQPRPGQNPNAKPELPRIIAPAPLSPELAKLAQQMRDGVNAQRQQNGLASYVLDEQLTLSAQAHGQDMVARGYFSHGTPEGATLQDRLVAQGVFLNWTGENIQRNIQPYDQSAQYGLNWFMSSRPHRFNILHPHYTRFGVGVVEGPEEWYTYVLVFGGD